MDFFLEQEENYQRDVSRDVNREVGGVVVSEVVAEGAQDVFTKSRCVTCLQDAVRKCRNRFVDGCTQYYGCIRMRRVGPNILKYDTHQLDGIFRFLLYVFLLGFSQWFFFKVIENNLSSNALHFELISIALSIQSHRGLWHLTLNPPALKSFGCKDIDLKKMKKSLWIISTDQFIRCAFLSSAFFIVSIHILAHILFGLGTSSSVPFELTWIRIVYDLTIFVLGLSSFLPDVFKALIFLFYKWKKKSDDKKAQRKILRIVRRVHQLYIFLLIVFGLLILARCMGTTALPHLETTVLKGFKDPCASVDRQLNPHLASSFVTPSMIPRFVYNLYLDRGKTQPDGWHSFGYVDKDEEVLLLTPKCAHGGGKPRVFLHRVDLSIFILNDEVDYKLIQNYQDSLESLFGDNEKARAASVIVHREETTKRIHSIEMNPISIIEEKREPRSAEEREARRWWPAGNLKTVLQVPLGQMSSAYSVVCENDEEFFVHPVKSSSRSETRPEAFPITTNSADNVLVLFFDAISRQSAVRQLPSFVNWTRHFKKRHDARLQHSDLSIRKNAYVVQEVEHTTLGSGTKGNLVPYLTARGHLRAQELKIPIWEWSFFNYSIFNEAKKKYGDRLSTHFVSDLCEDIQKTVFDTKVSSSLVGDGHQGVDSMVMHPSCHPDYNQHKVLGGSSGIHRRWIAHRPAHSHIFDYLEILMRRRLRESVECRKNKDRDDFCDQLFFDFSYFVEGHETSHGVLRTIDEDLTAFLEKLEEIGFFDAEGRNALMIISDHGNHMGIYSETNPGFLEQSLPLMLYFIPSVMLERIDKRKGQEAGVSKHNFELRADRLNTPLDTYLTLKDMLGLDLDIGTFYNDTFIPPASLFDLRDTRKNNGTQPQRCEDFYGTHGECALSYCI